MKGFVCGSVGRKSVLEVEMVIVLECFANHLCGRSKVIMARTCIDHGNKIDYSEITFFISSHILWQYKNTY